MSDAGDTTQIECPNGCLHKRVIFCPLCHATGWCSVNAAAEEVKRRASETINLDVQIDRMRHGGWFFDP